MGLPISIVFIQLFFNWCGTMKGLHWDFKSVLNRWRSYESLFSKISWLKIQKIYLKCRGKLDLKPLQNVSSLWKSLMRVKRFKKGIMKCLKAAVSKNLIFCSIRGHSKISLSKFFNFWPSIMGFELNFKSKTANYHKIFEAPPQSLTEFLNHPFLL